LEHAGAAEPAGVDVRPARTADGAERAVVRPGQGGVLQSLRGRAGAGRPMTEPLVGMAIVLGVLGGLLGTLAVYRRVAAPHPELLRKMMHVGMGLTTLSFPWLFDRAWPVLALGGLSVVLLVCLRTVGRLRAGVGQVVGGVARFSLGDIYFPLAVA